MKKDAFTDPALPQITANTALFLDFDGTLADLATTPESVVISPDLVPLLQHLSGQLQGALAIVSGRQLQSLDAFLAPLQLPTASEHGAFYRLGGAPNQPTAQASPPDFKTLAPEVFALAALHPGLQVESKSACLALHYRHAPDLQQAALAAMQHAVCRSTGLVLLQGKQVFEIKPGTISKGRAVNDFMLVAPFAGRTPVFVGDDVTDEAGLLAAQALGGMGVKVGDGPTAAACRVPSPSAVIAWLQRCSNAFTSVS